MLLPGGYPELHAGQLANSQRSLQDLPGQSAQACPSWLNAAGCCCWVKPWATAKGTATPWLACCPSSAQRGELSLGYREALASCHGLVVRRRRTLCGP